VTCIKGNETEKESEVEEGFLPSPLRAGGGLKGGGGGFPPKNPQKKNR